MRDRDFLIWLHERLHHQHGEYELLDYMHKLRTIIAGTPKDKVTPNTGIYSGMKELQEHLNKTDDHPA